jgi:hypothetical protein
MINTAFNAISGPVGWNIGIQAGNGQDRKRKPEGAQTGDAFEPGSAYPDMALQKRMPALINAAPLREKADVSFTAAEESPGEVRDDAYWQSQFKTFLQNGSFINGDCSWGKVVTVSDRNSKDGMIALAFATGGYTGTHTSLVSYPKELGTPLNGDGTFVNSAGMKVYFFDLKANPFLQPGIDMALKFNTSPMGGGTGIERDITLKLAA